MKVLAITEVKINVIPMKREYERDIDEAKKKEEEQVNPSICK